MKKELKIGIAAVLVLGFGSQVGATYNQIKQFVHEMRVQLAEDRETEAVMSATQERMERAGTGPIPSIGGSDADSITEEFKISEILDGGYVRGESTNGTGEGIYYSMDTFKKYGAGVVKIGDVVQVTRSYENNELNNSIEKIELKN